MEILWNYQYASTGPFITDRTAHIVNERHDSKVKTECGRELSYRNKHIEEIDGVEDYDGIERHKCGNCPW